MNVEQFIRQLEGDYRSERLLREYIAEHPGWAAYNNRYVWQDFSAPADTALDFAHLYFQKPRRFLGFLHSLSLGAFAVPSELGPNSIAFVPLKNHNAHCCLSPDGSPVILIDIFLDRILGELCAAATTFIPWGAAYEKNEPYQTTPDYVTMAMKSLGHYADALRRLSGDRTAPATTASIFDQILLDASPGSVNWQLAHEYQDAMLFFAILHELAHYINADVGEFTTSMLADQSDAPVASTRVESAELAADKIAWNIWALAANSGDVNLNPAFQLDFLQKRGGAPGLLFVALDQGHYLYRNKAKSFAHAAPWTRFENYRALISQRGGRDAQLANDTAFRLMLWAIKVAGASLTSSADSPPP